jgi:uncharacterized protein (DUF1778 family)
MVGTRLEVLVDAAAKARIEAAAAQLDQSASAFVVDTASVVMGQSFPKTHGQ